MTIVTLQGNFVVLIGFEGKVGLMAPYFRVQKNNLSEYTPKSWAGKTRVIVSVPSPDTSVCDLEAQRFNQEAARFPDGKIIYVRMDLPFAQKRWCGAANADKVITLIDPREESFAKNYGVLISGDPLDRLAARVVFVWVGWDRITKSNIRNTSRKSPSSRIMMLFWQPRNGCRKFFPEFCSVPLFSVRLEKAAKFAAQ